MKINKAGLATGSLHSARRITAVILFALFLVECGPALKEEENTYICPMECTKDSSILFTLPGQCPVCQMDLITKKEFEEENNNEFLKTLIKPTDAFVISSLQLSAPQEKKMAVEYSATGKISYDTRTLAAISSRYSGRIEKLYVRYLFQPVTKGQKLFDIYSPELVTAQQNLIYLLENDSLSTSLINAAKQKLLLYGLTDAQLNTILKTKKAEYALSVFSPVDGYIYEENNANTFQEAPKGGMGMSGAKAPDMAGSKDNASGTVSAIREGMYVTKGQTVFNVVNLENVWAVLKINPQDIPKVKLHQPVTLTIENLPDSALKGKVDFIEPLYESRSAAMNVRVYLENKKNRIKPGYFVTAVLQADSVKGTWIQKKAVLDIGKNKIVWKKNGDAFEAHTIVTGTAMNDWVEIRDGVWEGDSIASDAQYLMDSESFIKITEDE